MTDRMRQVDATLPMKPALAHWAIVGATSVLMTTLLFTAAMPLAELKLLSLPFAAWVGCVGLITVQHRGHVTDVADFGVMCIVLICFPMFILAVATGHMDSRAVGLVAAVVAVLFLTNGLAPEVVDRWRGAGLTYPTRGQLWTQRVLWLAAGCLVPVASGVVLRPWPLVLSIALPFVFAIMRLLRGWSIFD